MSAALVPVLLMGTFAAAPAPTDSTSPPPLIGASPSASVPSSANLYDNVAVPLFQLLSAEGIVALSFLASDHGGDWGTAVVLATPATVSLSTCGIGATSLRHLGSCWHSLVGSGLGIVSGFFVYALLEAVPSLNPWKPNPDDTQTFINAAASFFYVALLGIPVGSVVGWNVGRVPVPESPVDEPSPSTTSAPPAPLPPPALASRGDTNLRFVVPLLAFRF